MRAAVLPRSTRPPTTSTVIRATFSSITHLGGFHHHTEKDKMAARTRRQKAALAAQSDGDESPAGNGSAQKLSPKKNKSSPDDEVQENVYLFAPNLIGKELDPP